MFDITSTTTATPVIPFADSAVAPANYRIIGLHYKSRAATADKPAVAKRPSVMLCAPLVTVAAVEPQELAAALQECVNELQDELARSIAETGASTIAFDSLNAASIATFAATKATSKRLNADSIRNWFDTASGIQEKLMAALTAALNLTDGSDLDMTKLVRAVEVYRNRFADLASPKPAISNADAEKLLKWAMQSTDQDSSIYQSVIAKLNIITKRVDAELLI